MKIKQFEDFEIWREARALCQWVYQITSKDSFSKDFKLRDQIRGSSGSVMDNIAEGFDRGGNKEFIQFLSIAKGSSGEMRSQAYRAFDVGYINQEQFDTLCSRAISLSRKISGLMKYLKNSELKGPKYKNDQNILNHDL